MVHSILARAIRRRLPASITVCAAAALLLSSSCTMPPQLDGALTTPRFPETNAHYRVESSEQVSDAASDAPPASRIVPLAHEETTDVGVASLEDLSPEPAPQHSIAALPAASSEGTASQQRRTDALAVHNAVQPVGQFVPADPRVALPVQSSCPPDCPVPWAHNGEVVVPIAEADAYPEEYLCDGGDRNGRVDYDQFGRLSLDTEDTVAVFTDEAGCRHIRPSCRACIYAPQFAAVRSSTMPQENLAVDRLASAHDHRSTVGLGSHLRTGVALQNDQALGLNVRSRPSGLDQDVANRGLEQVAAPARHIKINNVFENELFLSRGELNRAEEAYLAYLVQLAATWTREQNPVIVASDSAGQELIAEFQAEEYVGIEERPPGDLKIIKLVDVPSAVPGDVVTFSIHYENTGDGELFHVSVVDNLTPRLELIADSTKSDRPGSFKIEDNNEGSVQITFELADPLPGRTSGTITFQCRVR